MSRIAAAFTSARKEGRAAFIPYITAGDPSLARTAELVASLSRAGADVIELGVPFSDPIADGRTNQRAAERALASGTTLGGILQTVTEIRSREDSGQQTPIVLFTYSNPVVQYGIDRFVEDAVAAGIDGLLLTDVPYEEIGRFAKPLKKVKIDPVMLVTPTSTRERVKAAARVGRGFLYFVSRTGVTGVQPELEAELGEQVRRTRKLSRLPVAVGFGISTPAQVKQVATLADGVVVGSAIVEQVGRVGDSDRLGTTIERLVTPLAQACRR